MPASQGVSARAMLASVGALAVVAALVFGWYRTRPPAPPPGSVGPVPTAGRAPAIPLAEGVVLPHLSAVDAAKLKRGESVTIDVPGGKIELGPPKKGGKK